MHKPQSEGGYNMNIPKELQKTEVQKFEDLVGILVYAQTEILKGGEEIRTHFNNILNIVDYWYFYTQPFSPTMIEEYFEGVLSAKTTYCLPNGEEVHCEDWDDEGIIYFMESADKHSQCWVNRLIKTLSDFIDACLNSDISLRWK